MWVKVDAKRMGDAFPDTSITIGGKNLHAPLIERILELPMDIYAGQWALWHWVVCFASKQQDSMSMQDAHADQDLLPFLLA